MRQLPGQHGMWTVIETTVPVTGMISNVSVTVSCEVLYQVHFSIGQKITAQSGRKDGEQSHAYGC